ncbi:uncharacterized protein LOC121837829 [Ixodes scapularis]|uniref:uncharacterized protein LOC121837829 n=1 Tax=Ixodes scapularis TaxID=6945 RepID=UPI001C38FD41|nr:uncharacterized protein LOC121837829 [Ixodes scapularis]
MDRLKTKRRVRRSQNTKIITDITTALHSTTLDINSLKNLRDRLIASNEELRKVNEEIEPLITDADLEADYVAVVADYEDEVARALSEVRNKIERQPAAPAIYQVGDDGDGVIPQATGVKLPKLQLLQYQGELTLWQPFWEQFQTAVHRNTRLTEGDKFQYLRSLLSGPAASAISGLQTTAECYKDAIEILSERFGNKQRIQREYLERLRSLPMVKSDRDVRGLRNIYDHVQTNIRGLRALGVSSATYSTMMMDVLLSNLPTDILVEYHRLKRYGIGLGVPINGRERAGTTDDGQPLDDVSPSPTDSNEELDKLLRFMRVEIESREQSSPLERRPTTVPTVAQNQRQGANPPSTLVLHTRGTDNTCFFCNYRTHRTGDCPSDITLDEKKKMLAQDIRCFRCTKRGHRSRDCRSQQRCTGCRGRHVTSMCNPAWEALSTVQETANVLTAGSTPTVHTPSVLLQTFRSWVGTGLNQAYIRGIIDGGSQKTFIREDLARKLNLKVVGERIMQLNTFACSDSNRCRQKFTVVRIHIRGQYKTADHVLEAVVVPFICQNIIETPVEHTFLKTIPGDIADKLMFPSTRVEAGISLLIGADQMWKLLTGETRRSPCNTGLVAIATTLGWTFQGPTSTVSVLSDNTTNLMVCVLNVGGADEEDDAALKHFWELETIGIVDEPMDKKQQEEKVFEQFKENIRQKNDSEVLYAVSHKMALSPSMTKQYVVTLKMDTPKR